MTDIVERLGRRIHNQRVRLRYWEELFNEHVHAHLHALHPRHLMKAIELGNENFRLRQLLSEAEKREKEARAKALGDAASAIFVMGAWSPHYEKLVPNTFDEGTSAAYEIVREIQGKAESALQPEER